MAPLVNGQDKDHGPFGKSIASLTKRNVLSEPKPGAGRPGRRDPDQRRRDRCDHVSALPGLTTARVLIRSHVMRALVDRVSTG